jgi:hypothetical protein
MTSPHQLARWLMREVHGVDIGRRSPRPRRKGPPRDWKYRAWIRTLPCAACGSTSDIEAAHTGQDGGMRQKSSDYSYVPLCENCHRWARRHKLDISKLVRKLNWAWFKGGRF